VVDITLRFFSPPDPAPFPILITALVERQTRLNSDVKVPTAAKCVLLAERAEMAGVVAVAVVMT
jgi:hypothetical protein